MLLQNLKNFFVKNKVLSSAFVVLLAVCFFGGLFGLNQLVRETNLYNAYMFEKRTYTVNVPDGVAVDAALSAYISRHKSKNGIIQAEISNFDNPSEKLTALCFTYDGMDYPATVGNNIMNINSDTSKKEVILNGERLEEKIGTKYMINGEEYTVIGVDNSFNGTNVIAYNSLSNKNCVKSIEILLINVLTQKEHEELSETLYELFTGCGIVLPDVSGV
ncbi:MAG: hypothetical protein GX802_07110 [Clostridiales bacterium]|nr:hypothetical protein [Clostridiales bacterium]